MQKVVIITGPTGIGKTNLSIQLAKKYCAEIINADASQFKRDLCIGTAKITSKEQQGVVHHLLNILGPTERFSIKDYQEQSRSLIDEISSRGNIPFMVGGSGLYISSAIGNYHFAETPTVNEDEYDDYTNQQLYEMLCDLDANSTNKIHKNNRRRVIRAIALAKSDVKISENNEGTETLYDTLIICLRTERSILYERINNRFDAMIKNGWVDEVKNLIVQQIDLSKITDIGYQEIGKYLANELTFQELSNIVKQKTRNYAKRQITWFNNKFKCHYLDMNYIDEQENFVKACELIDKFLIK